MKGLVSAPVPFMSSAKTDPVLGMSPMVKLGAIDVSQGFFHADTMAVGDQILLGDPTYVGFPWRGRILGGFLETKLVVHLCSFYANRYTDLEKRPIDGLFASEASCVDIIIERGALISVCARVGVKTDYAILRCYRRVISFSQAVLKARSNIFARNERVRGRRVASFSRDSPLIFLGLDLEVPDPYYAILSQKTFISRLREASPSDLVKNRYCPSIPANCDHTGGSMWGYDSDATNAL